MLNIALGIAVALFALAAFGLGALFLLEKRKNAALLKSLGDAEVRWSELERHAAELMKFDPRALQDKISQLERDKANLQAQVQAQVQAAASGATADASHAAATAPVQPAAADVQSELLVARRRISELESRIRDWESAYRKLGAERGG